MTYYRIHVFVCENKRPGGKECCAARPAAEGALKTLRGMLKENGMLGRGKIRINRAGCFNRCSQGPVLAVYPEGVWYRYDNENDLREIAETHLIGGSPVTRLMLENDGD